MASGTIRQFPLLDTHTGGEITRVALGEPLGLGAQSAQGVLAQLRDRLDWVRQSLTSEPRGSAFAVGAVVTPNDCEPDSWSVVFFNNVGYLGMCGHGLIGVVEALRHWGLIGSGSYRFATPPGTVTATLDESRQVTFTGVQSFCQQQNVRISCDDGSEVIGDIAYGGNWFFMVRDDSLPNASTDQLTRRCQRIRDAIDRQNIRGREGAIIDHVELYCPFAAAPAEEPLSIAKDGAAQGTRNFVLCPGGHYDRSPCGTGTSAKLAILAAKEQLAPGIPWIQQSVTGSRFIASYQPDGEGVRVTLRGRAHVIAETLQIFDSHDPLAFGIGNTPGGGAS